MKTANQLNEEKSNLKGAVIKKPYIHRPKPVTIKFKKLVPEAEIPQYAHIGDAGMDVKCTSIEYDHDNDVFIYHTGIACSTPKGYALLAMPRSSNCKTDLYLANGIGLIDSATYRGEIQFRFKMRDSYDTIFASNLLTHLYRWLSTTNLFEVLKERKSLWTYYNHYKRNDDRFIIQTSPYQVGDRIGQLVLIPLPIAKVIEVDELSETSRGEGGFGSTGE